MRRRIRRMYSEFVAGRRAAAMDSRKRVAHPHGHYYSAIPSDEDVREYMQWRQAVTDSIPGLRLNKEAQFRLLKEYSGLYADIPFPERQAPGFRYYYDNGWFGYSDAIFLCCFLRKFMPRRIVEVGSGFSSAVTLDTIDRFYAQKPTLTFIEPHPERLISLFRADDRERVKLIARKVQSVPLEELLALERGDLLFIDSSHVLKVGSDVQRLLFDVVPRLKPGVFVHFHDVLYPFDYPPEWALQGHFPNESFFLRAFLSFNTEWDIVFFNTYVHYVFADFIKENMPLCARNPGGSLYLQRSPACPSRA